MAGFYQGLLAKERQLKTHTSSTENNPTTRCTAPVKVTRLILITDRTARDHDHIFNFRDNSLQASMALGLESVRRSRWLDCSAPLAHPMNMKHVPSLVGVVILFGIVYFLTEATLTMLQMAFGIVGAILVYSATMAWHIRNLLE